MSKQKNPQIVNNSANITQINIQTNLQGTANINRGNELDYNTINILIESFKEVVAFKKNVNRK